MLATLSAAQYHASLIIVRLFPVGFSFFFIFIYRIVAISNFFGALIFIWKYCSISVSCSRFAFILWLFSLFTTTHSQQAHSRYSNPMSNRCMDWTLCRPRSPICFVGIFQDSIDQNKSFAPNKKLQDTFISHIQGGANKV